MYDLYFKVEIVIINVVVFIQTLKHKSFMIHILS